MVEFVVQLADGSEHRFEVDTVTLHSSGEAIARVIARTHQEAGLIPKGEIVEVRRAPWDG